MKLLTVEVINCCGVNLLAIENTAIFIAFFKHYEGILIACQKVERSAPLWLAFMVLKCPTAQNFDLLK